MSCHHRYTQEQEQFLREQIGVCDSYADLTQRFNARFGTALRQHSVQDKCTKQMKIHRGRNSGQFEKHGQPRALPIGTVRRSQTGTYINVREVPVDAHISGYARPYWIPLQEKVWIDAHGSVPTGHMICFLDGNTQNFAPDNLYPITRAASVRMAQNKWWSSDPRITKSGIMCCNLMIALRRKRECG